MIKEYYNPNRALPFPNAVFDLYGKLCPVLVATYVFDRTDPHILIGTRIEYSFEFNDVKDDEFPIEIFPFFKDRVVENWEYSFCRVRHSIDVERWLS